MIYEVCCKSVNTSRNETVNDIFQLEKTNDSSKVAMNGPFYTLIGEAIRKDDLHSKYVNNPRA